MVLILVLEKSIHVRRIKEEEACRKGETQE